MKRILCLIIAASTLLGITACSSPAVKETTPTVTDATETIPAVTAPVLEYTVANPTPYPDYSVPEDYTTDDLRQIAIVARKVHHQIPRREDTRFVQRLQPGRAHALERG